VLRRYSLVTGWDNFVINNDNIKSKTSTDNTCTNDGIWEIGLTTGATCLKLTNTINKIKPISNLAGALGL
jgi:16S rRNA A1518/A1519 N6-dimethyltransferase RsmA/KsgA/DIM1 with predicted DNA glycosylase/AP lyase activity